MRVTNCTQNTMSKQSFGMKFKLDIGDIQRGIPCRDQIIDALVQTNLDEKVASLMPAEVCLRYKNFENDVDPQGNSCLLHYWLMQFQDFMPFAISHRSNADQASLVDHFKKVAANFAASIEKQQAQRQQEAARIASDLQKATDAGLL